MNFHNGDIVHVTFEGAKWKPSPMCAAMLIVNDDLWLQIAYGGQMLIARPARVFGGLVEHFSKDCPYGQA